MFSSKTSVREGVFQSGPGAPQVGCQMKLGDPEIELKGLQIELGGPQSGIESWKNAVGVQEGLAGPQNNILELQ